MDIHFDFGPDPERAQVLDKRMHTELADSLRHLREISRETVEFEESAMERLIASLEVGTSYPPLLFARYYQLAEALMQDDLSTASDLYDRLVRLEPLPEQQRVTSLSDPEQSEASAVYHRFMTEESDGEFSLLSPSSEVADAFRDRYHRGMKLLERTIPKLAGEIRAIVHDVIGVVGHPKNVAEFDGGSHFKLWGALFLNVERHSTLQQLIEGLAHESAHSLLFGFCTDEPLVYNDDRERYPSPLRDDLRPMDGIYHATYVSARMHWAMSRLLNSNELTDEQRSDLAQARAEDRRNFEQGYQMVAEHGDLSSVGAKLMQGARSYMETTSG